jgi:hypothetical protein
MKRIVFIDNPSKNQFFSFNDIISLLKIENTISLHDSILICNTNRDIPETSIKEKYKYMLLF